ncbi:RNA recognition motif [Bonamia ostreae]|uniref:RNA recognition motif n=1 Tax=Bonamia ostreae TaxID=126728 RepID=A0ABV2ATY4_9EUKA
MSRTNLYVSQFPREWGSDKLEILFAKFGQIDKIRILTPENAEKNRGVGFVHFKEAASAFAAMTATQNFTPKNCFKPIIVKFANQGAKPPRVLNAGPNVCRFWAKGECARGELCNFKHDSYETREEFGVSGAFGGVGGFGAAPLGAFYKGGDVGVAGKAEGFFW